MARQFAQVFSAIWDDPDFRTLEPSPQRLYLFLLSQSNINYAGVIMLSPRRWASRAADYPETALLTDLAVLIDRRYVVVDPAEEELLVRSYIRNDGLWKNPKTMKSARRDALATASLPLREALIAELKRLPITDLPDRTRDQIADEVYDLVGRLTEGIATRSLGGSQGVATPLLTQGQGSIAIAGVGEVVKDRTSVEVVEDPLIGEPAVPDGAVPPLREDVERLCVRLADRVEENGSKRPDVNRHWRTAARLMLDKDNRTEAQIMRAIDWCQDHEFWRGNVMSMPKLRRQYDQLRLQAQRKPQSNGNGHASTEGVSVRDEWMARR